MSFEAEISVFRPDRPGIRKVLGDLEAEIMELIWARPIDQGTTVRDVFEQLYQQRRIAYTTVMSTMSRLAKKNLLAVEKYEQGYVYRPTFTQQEFIEHFVSRILKDLFVSFAEPTLAGLDALADPQALAQARLLLEEISQRRLKEEAE
jgi:predicted transcriptional regulator